MASVARDSEVDFSAEITGEKMKLRVFCCLCGYFCLFHCYLFLAFSSLNVAYQLF